MAHRECSPGATITSTASQQTLCDQQTPTHQTQTQQPQNPQAERPSQQEDQRRVHLIVYNSPLFKAHWGLFIPGRGSSPTGKLIHVVGDVLRGFHHEFRRNYNISYTTRPHRVIAIGHVADNIIVDVPGDGESSTDTTPHDNLERIALGVPAPGPSLNSVSNAPPTRAITQQNCQTWMVSYIDALVENNLIDEDAGQRIRAAPQH